MTTTSEHGPRPRAVGTPTQADSASPGSAHPAHPPERAGGAPPASPPRPGDDPLQRWLVAFALAFVAAIVALAAGCGGSPDEPLPDGRAAIPQAPSASQAI
jgi:hypothetical protein